ncbi:MAG: hypothetical protein D6791_14040 [Chloroflexi bacterium]|nr:MAG: hypothetical protein D6791_14040 [Chloroflexota bacterium]
MRGIVQLSVIGFAIALGVGVGHRLSPEAMAVVVGVVCGVLASIPMSVMMLVLTRRLSGPARSRQATSAPPGMAYPPVVVIQPGSEGAGKRYLPPAWDPPAAVENQPWQRSYTVVGEEEGW